MQCDAHALTYISGCGLDFSSAVLGVVYVCGKWTSCRCIDPSRKEVTQYANASAIAK